MPGLKLYLFGAPRLERGDEILSIGRSKSLALLTYLAVTNEPQTR